LQCGSPRGGGKHRNWQLTSLSTFISSGTTLHHGVVKDIRKQKYKHTSFLFLWSLTSCHVDKLFHHISFYQCQYICTSLWTRLNGILSNKHAHSSSVHTTVICQMSACITTVREFCSFMLTDFLAAKVMLVVITQRWRWWWDGWTKKEDHVWTVFSHQHNIKMYCIVCVEPSFCSSFTPQSFGSIYLFKFLWFSLLLSHLTLLPYPWLRALSFWWIKNDWQWTFRNK